MTATVDHGLQAPKIKGALRQRPPHGILRARAILYGVVAMVLIAAGLLLMAAVLFRVKGGIDLVISLWPAYVVAGLAFIAPRGYRNRRLWSFALSLAIGLVLVVGAVALFYLALVPGATGGAAGASAAPGASGVVASAGPAASAVAAGSAGASGAPAAAAGGTVDGNVAFGLVTLGGFFFAFGLPLIWGLVRERSFFLGGTTRHPIKTAEEIEAETGAFTEITPLATPATDAAGSALPTAQELAVGAVDPLVSVRGLKKHFPILGGVLRRQVGTIYAVDGVDFDVYPGEVFSVVGESGCGKTTLGRTLLQLTPPTAGHVVFDGYELADVDPDDMRPLRRRMQIIFQDPFGSLNPRMPVSDIIGEGLLAQGVTDRKERDKRTGDALEVVGLRRDYSRRYPHEFSGGQRQRIGVARALALSPDFIVCDEPVSALDVSIQSQVLNLLLDLKRDFKLTYLFISHNLSVVEYFSDRIAVMYLGRVAEIGTVDELYRNPRHPYTVALLSAIPIADPRRRRRRLVLKGDVPSPAAPPSGCRFHTRCWLRERLGNPERCATEDPALRPMTGDVHHRAACHFAEEISESAVAETVETQDVVETAAAAE
jgi:peptide/nickel transport system ATP-binding protein